MTILNLIESSKILNDTLKGLPVPVICNVDSFYPDFNLVELTLQNEIPNPVIDAEEYFYQRDFAISIMREETKCFSKHSSKNSECADCMISDMCSEKKIENNTSRKKARTKKAALEEKANKAGFSFKGLRVSKKIRMDSFKLYDCKSEISCILTGKTIKVGEQMAHYKGWGIVHPDCTPILIEWRK